MLALTLSEAAAWAAVATGLAAVVTAARASVEYRRLGAQKRAELFADIRKRFKGEPRFARLTELLVDDDPALETVPFIDKWDFLGLIEEVGLLTNSGLIDEAVSHHMFAYYALAADRSQHFWQGPKPLRRDDPNWRVFGAYCARMRDVGTRLHGSPTTYRF